MTTPTPLVLRLLVLSPLVLLGGCSAGDDGFGAQGERFEPAVDTGPFNSDGDADTDTDSDTDTDTDTSVDTADTSTDTADSGDTGIDIVGTGYSAGKVAFNFKAPDQSDDIWALYQHYGNVVVLGFGNGSDPYFIEMSGWLQGVADKYNAELALVLLTDGTSTQADVDDAALWSSTYGLENVLYKPLDGSVSTASWASTPPMVYVIDSELRIYWTNQGNTEEGQLTDKVKDLAL
jgi:hypothetical protein